ncbi:MAG: cysteate synthase [Spirochaetales bacterium]|nr:cysteate synthase [Spirochaetales bacterium]
MSFSPTRYTLESAATGEQREDEGWTLAFPGAPSLIRTVYEQTEFCEHDQLDGLYRFASWLPIRRTLKGSASPVCYQSVELAGDLGLKNLWVVFNGWWPERGAGMKTASFKECEAYSVCARLPEDFQSVLVVASAGNTARAFARVCSDNHIPLLLFVPEDNLNALQFDAPIQDCVKLIAPASGGDYFDAIRMSGVVTTHRPEQFLAEGGAKNVARRDGMGTTVLAGVSAMGRIPDAYFQAVGSGTGAIAAWEAARRFERDGRFGPNTMRLMVAQNSPFHPMADTWAANSRDFLIPPDDQARQLAASVDGKVLTNRRPPWGVPGGLYDALKATGGDVLTATNAEAREAAKRFEQREGIDISPAAAVAVASLFSAVEEGRVRPEEHILLNITGGGSQRFHQERELFRLEPSSVLNIHAQDDEILATAEKLFPQGSPAQVESCEQRTH